MMVAEAVKGRCNFPLTYTIRNGQIMLAPVVLISKPQKSNQNWRGYSALAFRKLDNMKPTDLLEDSALEYFLKYFQLEAAGMSSKYYQNFEKHKYKDVY